MAGALAGAEQTRLAVNIVVGRYATDDDDARLLEDMLGTDAPEQPDVPQSDIRSTRYRRRIAATVPRQT